MDKESGQFGILGATIGFISQAWTWLGAEVDWGGVVTAGINVLIGSIIAIAVKHFYSKYFAFSKSNNNSDGKS